MNIVFWLFIIILLIFLWFTLAFVFKPIGKFIQKLWNDVEKEIKGDN